MIVNIRQLEYHITNTCNLSCSQCNHYSNYTKGGTRSVGEVVQDFSLWHQRLAPSLLSILGGEPALNPHLSDIVEVACEMWRHVPHKKLVSNGLLLHRHERLPAILATQNVQLSVSVHHASPAYQEKIRGVRRLIATWKAMYPRLRVEWRNTIRGWRRTYRVRDGREVPFTSQPQKAWSNCGCRYCRPLYQGHIWKCPPLAYFADFQNARQLHDIAEWDLHRHYKPLHPSASQDEVFAWFRAKSEPACGLCAPHAQHVRRPNPLRPSDTSDTSDKS